MIRSDGGQPAVPRSRATSSISIPQANDLEPGSTVELTEPVPSQLALRPAT
jgi:hypothetical protein